MLCLHRSDPLLCSCNLCKMVATAGSLIRLHSYCAACVQLSRLQE